MNTVYIVDTNIQIAKDTYEMRLLGDTSNIKRSGQFINIKVSQDNQFFLRRPISIADYDASSITIIYKVFGKGTKRMSECKKGDILDCLVGLGNGFSIKESISKNVCLIGGGVGVPPLYRLLKELKQQGNKVSVVLGFNTKEDVFYYEEFAAIADQVVLTTISGDIGQKGFVTDALDTISYDYYYACGPQPMLDALIKRKGEGQLSFEERMGCGFGACMGCSCKTLTGYKRICVEGPVLHRSEVLV